MLSLRLVLLAIIASIALPLYALDTQQPSIPNAVTATAISSDAVRVTWNRPWDDVGVHGYNVYRNSAYFATVFDTNFIDNQVTDGSTYSYSVVAFDEAKNYTPTSSQSSATVGGGNAAPPPPQSSGDSRPGAPATLRVEVQNGNQARIFWSAPSGSVTGYNVYRNGNYRGTVDGNDYTDSSLTWGQDYRFQIVAFNGSALFSNKSAELIVNTSNNSSPVALDDGRNVANSTPDSSSGVPAGYQLVFSDEFREYNINGSKWNSSYRWGPNWTINGEKQYYVDRINNPDFGHSPFEFDGENLTITATRTPEHLRSSANWQPYLSGALTTHNKFKMRYGYVEMRAKMPRGRGLWPAFWLLHQNDNDRRPEIDVVELIGDRPDIVYNTYHYYDNWNLRSTPSYKVQGPDYSQDYHTYAVKWEPGRNVWYVDGQERNRHDNGNVSWEDMYLLVNLAVGGSWPGDPDGNTPFPARYSIDYIRAYQRN